MRSRAAGSHMQAGDPHRGVGEYGRNPRWIERNFRTGWDARALRIIAVLLLQRGLESP